MSDNPIKLWPGPCEDGRETYFAKGADVGATWEWRTATTAAWHTEPADAPSLTGWYQCRPPARLPDPEAPYWAAGNELVVSWAQMRDRADLDQWERLAGTSRRSWVDDWSTLGLPDDYPIRVRRKQR